MSWFQDILGKKFFANYNLSILEIFSLDNYLIITYFTP